jgi:microcystin-dependent protein
MEGYIAEIRFFAATFAPRNWAYCSGQLISINTNTALFSLLGTTYGGNGTTTFALPDFRGRVGVGVGTGAGLGTISLGQVAGTNSITVSASNMPAHNHGFTGVNIKVNGAAGDGASPVGGVIAGKANSYAEGFGANQFLAQGSVAGNTDIAGSSSPMNVMNPYLGMNYIICQFGIFPSRN